MRPGPRSWSPLDLGGLAAIAALLQFGRCALADEIASPSCLSTAQQGSEDRSDITIRVVKRYWTSHQLVQTIIRIVLNELLGYNVVIVDGSEWSDAEWGADMAVDELYDVEPESWFAGTTSTSYRTYVASAKSIHAAEIGYSGRSGLWVMQKHVDKEPLADYYKFFLNSSKASAAGFLTFGESSLADFLGDDFPLCDVSEYYWCGAGALSGFWATPKCRQDPSGCLEIWMAVPAYDTGYFEQLTRNTGLPVVHAYTGWDLPTRVANLKDQERTPIFYWWEPDPFLQLVEAKRISFPDYYVGCDSGNNFNPENGTVACDYGETRLKKLVRSHVRETAPEAYLFLDNLELDITRINSMLSLHQDGAGNMTSEEAACYFVKSNLESLVASWVPECISHPEDALANGYAFNSETMECESSLYPSAASTVSCPAIRPEGKVDRSDTTIKLCARSDSWVSYAIILAVAELLLKEVLGYNVIVVDASAGADSNWAEELSLEVFDVNLECWHAFGDDYTKYVEEEELFTTSSTGYSGRSGLYTLTSKLTKEPMADYYKFFWNAEQAISANFRTFAPSELRATLDSDFPVCDVDEYAWCGNGTFEGYWVGDNCYSDPELCLEVILAGPHVDTGYFEQLVVNNDIAAVFAYYGFDGLQAKVTALEGTGQGVLFYWWEPDPFLTKIDASRVSFPDFAKGCTSGDTDSPSGSVACDYEEVELLKVMLATLQTRAPEAYYSLQQLQLSPEDLQTMMANHLQGVGSMTSEEVACDWLTNHPEELTSFAPDCIAEPLAGSQLFDTDLMTCVDIDCAANTVITSTGSTVACATCPEGYVPDESQRSCTICAMGSAVGANGSQCVDCDPGRYAGLPGMTECSYCPGGTIQSETGASVCSSCLAGQYQDTPGQTQCLQCPGGTIAASAGSSSCLSCPEGAYAEPGNGTSCSFCELGYYSDSVASTSCTRCPTGFVTHYPGSTGQDDCVCDEDTYLSASHRESCQACPEGMLCAIGSDETNLPRGPGVYPEVEEGYMTLLEDPMRIYACLIAEDCPGGATATCASLRDPTSVACATCSVGAYEQDGACIACSGGVDYLPIIIAGVVCFLGLILLAHAANREMISQTHTSLSIVMVAGLSVSALQAMGFFRRIAVSWPSPLSEFMKAAALFSFDFSQLKVGCVVGSEPLTEYIFSLTPVPLAVPVLAITLLLKHRRHLHLWVLLPELANSLGAVLNFFFICISIACFSPFMCYDHPGDAGSSLLSYPAVLCFEGGVHNSFILVGSVALALVPIPFLVASTWAVSEYRKVVSGHAKLKTFVAATRFMFMRYKPSRYYYNVILLLRSGLISLVPVIFRGDEGLQLWVMGAIFISYMGLVMWLKPWLTKAANVMDGVITATLITLVVSGALSMDVSSYNSSFVVAAVVVVCVFLATVGGTLSWMTWMFLFPRPSYEWFICHHKADAAAQARFLKHVLEKRSRKTCFIDSDDLLELDSLFDIVKLQVNHLLVYLTRDTLRRPWCAGEIATAVAKGLKRITPIKTSSFQRPNETDLLHLNDYLDLTSCNLALFGISNDMILDGFFYITDSKRPSIHVNEGAPGTLRFHWVVSQLLGEACSLASGVKLRPTPGNVVLSCDRRDDETLAAVAVLVSKIEERVVRVQPDGVLILADWTIDCIVDIAEIVTTARAVVVVLSAGCLHAEEHLVAMIELGVLSSPGYRSATERASATAGKITRMDAYSSSVKQFEGPVIVPVALPGFVFPSQQFYEEGLPKLWPDGGESAQDALENFFRLIALPLTPATSDSVITAQADMVFRRMRLSKRGGVATPEPDGAKSPKSTKNTAYLTSAFQVHSI